MSTTTRGLCRQWHYAEAKLSADRILHDEDAFDRQAEGTESTLRDAGAFLSGQQHGGNTVALAPSRPMEHRPIYRVI